MIDKKKDNLLADSNTEYLKENSTYLESQLITYIGNKRALLKYIGNAVTLVQEKLFYKKLSFLDAFSGSGIVSRYFKSFANEIYTNDLEDYVTIINKCYLSNNYDRNMLQLQDYYNIFKEKMNSMELEDAWTPGIITNLYAPKDDTDIHINERVFYTTRKTNR